MTGNAIRSHLDGCEVCLHGKTALVTGSGRNIGRAVALELAMHGANLIINSASNKSESASVVGEIADMGQRAIAVVADVGTPEGVEAVVGAGIDEFGRIDISVSNANRRLYKSLFETTIDDWRLHLDMQLTASFLLAKLVIPEMMKQGWGRIIHINGPDGWYGGRFRLPAASGKAGLRNLTKSLAAELGQYGITVNDVVPGPSETVRDHSTHPVTTVDLVSEMPIGRLIKPEEVAWACLWLCDERSGGMNGTAIHVDGGWKMLG
jgi:3-oxoacyl-[acyl-carrier protein] reductase